MARAHLNPSDLDERLQFRKWYKSPAAPDGAFSAPGIGGKDSGVLPSQGCAGYQVGADLSWNEHLKSFLMVFVCASVPQKTAAWYFSTATSLDRQNWTPPQLVANSQFTLYPAPSQNPLCSSGSSFDGWYPSLVTPPLGTGRTAATGYAYFLKGCDGAGTRAFARRYFTIRRTPF
jgi:hypothetical protein